MALTMSQDRNRWLAQGEACTVTFCGDAEEANAAFVLTLNEANLALQNGLERGTGA
jgi:hypothetical protein